MTLRRLYRWQGRFANGQRCHGLVMHTDKAGARRQLLDLHIQPDTLSIQGWLPVSYWQRRTLAGILDRLAALLAAGLPLSECLQQLASDHPRAGWRCLLHQLSDSIIQGYTLSASCRPFADILPPACEAMLQLGEQSGQLAACCHYLAQHENALAGQKQQLRRALRYPLLICLMALLGIMVMLTVLLPGFAALYADLDLRPPAGLRRLSALSHFVSHYGWGLACIVLVVSIGYRRVMRYRPAWHYRLQAGTLMLPLFGTLIRAHNLALVFRVLAMTQQTGIGLDRGLQLARRTLRHSSFRQALWQVYQQVSRGEAVHQAFGGHPLFPRHCRWLIKTGELSGSLDKVFAQLAQLYQQQAQQQAQLLTDLAEPALMLMMALLVGGLAMMLYLPLLELGEAFSQF